MDDVEAIKAARRALRNVRNGIETREVSIEEVEADRARQGARLREFAVSVGIGIGTGSNAAQLAEELNGCGLPAPLAAYEKFRPAAEAREKAESILRSLECNQRNRASLAKAARIWAETCELAAEELRGGGGITLLNDSNAPEARRFASRTGPMRLLDWVRSPLARQVQARQREVGPGLRAARLMLQLDQAASARIARLSSDAHEVAHVGAEIEEARRVLVATPAPDAVRFQRALLQAFTERPETLELACFSVGLPGQYRLLAEHPGRLDALATVLRQEIVNLREVERWLEAVVKMPSFPERVLRKLPQVDEATSMLAEESPLSRSDLDPSDIGDTIRRFTRSLAVPRPSVAREGAFTPGR